MVGEYAWDSCQTLLWATALGHSYDSHHIYIITSYGLYEWPTVKGTLERQMNRYSNYELLIIDEISYLPIKSDDANLLFQLVNSRYEQHSTIITTNVPLSGWGEILNNPAAAETILDRLVYKSHIIKIAGKSYRLKSATNHKSPS